MRKKKCCQLNYIKHQHKRVTFDDCPNRLSPTEFKTTQMPDVLSHCSIGCKICVTVISHCWPVWLLLEALGRICLRSFRVDGRLQFLEVCFLLSFSWGHPHCLETFLALVIGLDTPDPALADLLVLGPFPASPPALFSLARENSLFLRVIWLYWVDLVYP